MTLTELRDKIDQFITREPQAKDAPVMIATDKETIHLIGCCCGVKAKDVDGNPVEVMVLTSLTPDELKVLGKLPENVEPLIA